LAPNIVNRTTCSGALTISVRAVYTGEFAVKIKESVDKISQRYKDKKIEYMNTKALIVQSINSMNIMDDTIILHLSPGYNDHFEKVMDVVKNQLGEVITIMDIRMHSLLSIATLKFRDHQEIREVEKMIQDLCPESHVRLSPNVRISLNLPTQ
jgi:hypothetical protein